MKTVIKRILDWHKNTTSEHIERMVEKSCIKFDDKVLASYARHQNVVLKQAASHDERMDKAEKLIDAQMQRNADDIERRTSAGVKFRKQLAGLIQKLSMRILASYGEDSAARAAYYEETVNLELLKRDIKAERGASDAAVF